jgi:arylsulfatase A-like enzyme
MLCVQQYEYVFNGFDFDELYDPEADPYEMTNLAPDPAYAGVLRGMAEWIKSHQPGNSNARQYSNLGKSLQYRRERSSHSPQRR